MTVTKCLAPIPTSTQWHCRHRTISESEEWIHGGRPVAHVSGVEQWDVMPVPSVASVPPATRRGLGPGGPGFPLRALSMNRDPH